MGNQPSSSKRSRTLSGEVPNLRAKRLHSSTTENRPSRKRSQSASLEVDGRLKASLPCCTLPFGHRSSCKRSSSASPRLGTRIHRPLYCCALPVEDIRLSLIGYDGQKLHCRLDIYNHNEAPPYDALSYCWGDSKETVIVMCNNSPLQIRTNLYDALCHISDGVALPRRPLWVDAICLNQNDEDEKAHQIPQMGRIYQSASRTLIWLGIEADNSSDALIWMKIYYQYIRSGDFDTASKAKRELSRQYVEHDRTAKAHGMLTEGQREHQKVLERAAELVARLADMPVEKWKSERYKQTHLAWRTVEAIPALLSRPWFERVWTTQELYLSHSRLVICGFATIDWTAFAQSLVHPAYGLDIVFLTRTFRPRSDRFWMGYRDAIATMKINSETELFQCPDIYMVLIESKKCMEPVDRVWGIVSLFHRLLRQRIWDANIIDYTMLGKQQYWKTYLSFMQILVQYSELHFWFLILSYQGLPKHKCLPSWCPDFNGLRQYASLRELAPAPAGPQAINIGFRAKEILNLEASLLMVQGFTIDIVRNSSMPAPLRESHEEPFQDFLQQVFSLVSEVIYLPGQSRHITDDMCQTLYMDASPENERKRSHLFRERLKDYDRIYQDAEEETYSLLLQPSIPWPTLNHDDFDRDRKHREKLVNAYGAWSHNRKSLADPEVLQGISLDQDSEGRSFFNTINGRFGFGPPDIRTGDLLCAFNLTQQVLVLRAVDVKTLQNSNIHSVSNLAKHSEFFHLIGDTYLSGCMHGAAFTAAGRGSDRMFVLA